MHVYRKEMKIIYVRYCAVCEGFDKIYEYMMIILLNVAM